MVTAPVRTTVVGLLVVSLGVLFAGCASIISDHTMEVWMDAHYADLIDSWGPPQRVFDDGSGGQVMVWVKNRESIVPGHVVDNVVDYDDDGSPRAFANYRPTQIYEYQVWRAFWVNSSGTIYRWEWQGE